MGVPARWRKILRRQAAKRAYQYRILCTRVKEKEKGKRSRSFVTRSYSKMIRVEASRTLRAFAGANDQTLGEEGTNVDSLGDVRQ